MKTLLLVYHSATGGTRHMAQAAAAAAVRLEPDLHVLLLPAAEATPAHLLAAQGYIFATPENLASMAGVMKDFFDRCYYPVLEQLNGRPYAAMVCAGTDGTGALRQLERIATGWRLRRVAEPIILRNGAQTAAAIAAPKHFTPAELARCAELGAAMAAGLALGVF